MHCRHPIVHAVHWGAALFALVILGCRPAPSTTQPASARARVPERIISIAPNATEIIVGLGETRRLVAVTTFCLLPPDAGNLPRVGGLFDPDLETIIRLRPDLIILRGRNEGVERLCAERGFRLYHDPTERLDDIFRTIRELGEILGRRSEADVLARHLRQRLDRIASAVASRPRPRVFVTIARNPDSLANVLTAGRATFVHDMIDLAGGENVFADLAMDYPQISPEAILAARPDVIIEAMPEREPSDALQQDVLRLWRGLGPVPAVRQGRVYVLTDDHALIPSPRVADIITRIARWLHPEITID